MSRTKRIYTDVIIIGGVMIMGYSQKNSKGVTYFLHSREGKGGAKLFFFSKDPNGSVDLPSEYETIEGPTGLPMVKRKK